MEIAHVEGTDGYTMRRIGARLAGKWCVTRLVGVGGMAAVYEARHPTGRRVAVKMMHAHLKENRRLYQRFIREAYVANSLVHPAVVPVYDVDVHDDGTPYLIMDLLIGESVEAFRKEQGGKLAAERATEIARVVLEVLVEAHSKGIIHRDLKPANLFITKQGQLKVLDFGIAKATQFDPLFTGTTRYGSLLGTPAFMSPEQARGHWDGVDHQSDLWSLGATLFTLLTGRAVHEATSANEQWALAMSAPTTSLRNLSPELPEQLLTAVDGALAFAKSERWPDAAHMFQALTGREAPGVPSAEWYQEVAPEELSTLSRAITLEGAVHSSPKQAGWQRQAFVLAAALGLVATVPTSQWNSSLQGVRHSSLTPQHPRSLQLSDLGVAERGGTQPKASAARPKETHARSLASEPPSPTAPKSYQEPGPSAQQQMRGSALAQAPARDGHVLLGNAPTAVPGAHPAAHMGDKDESLRSAPATRGVEHVPPRNDVGSDEPSLGEGVEFGALLDVWE